MECPKYNIYMYVTRESPSRIEIEMIPRGWGRIADPGYCVISTRDSE